MGIFMHDSSAQKSHKNRIYSNTTKTISDISAQYTLFSIHLQDDPTEFTQLFAVYGVALGFSMLLNYALTMKK